jgi:hypothetical protein
LEKAYLYDFVCRPAAAAALQLAFPAFVESVTAKSQPASHCCAIECQINIFMTLPRPIFSILPLLLLIQLYTYMHILSRAVKITLLHL